jgi:hypothetical protein
MKSAPLFAVATTPVASEQDRQNQAPRGIRERTAYQYGRGQER